MIILGVAKNSIGEELGLSVGDEVVSFDGIKLTDILDYEYYDTRESFSMEVKSGEKNIVFEIEKDEFETLGLEFDSEISIRQCRNNCIFCFVNQLPKHEKALRKTLFVKDDDYRHSFISGNYVTLTNLSVADIERIKRLRLSPLYVSVHSTDEQIRLAMLGISNKTDIKPILPLLRELKEAGIEIHTQIVYCPTINEDLEKTVLELSEVALSLAIVPVGLTKDANPILKKVNCDDAVRVLNLVHSIQKKLLKKMGTRFVWAADEFYLTARQDILQGSEYEGYPQIENGVGLMAKFNEDFEYALGELTGTFNIPNTSIATGVSAYEFISKKVEILNKRLSSGRITVHCVDNQFFGSSVTVAGLVTGSDIYRCLKDKMLADRLVIPSVMLKEFNDVFLDNMTLQTLSDKLGLAQGIRVSNNDGESFVRTLLNITD